MLTFLHAVSSFENSVFVGYAVLINRIFSETSYTSIVAWWLDIDMAQLPEGCPFTASPASLTIVRRTRQGHSQIERLNDMLHLYQAELVSGLPVLS